MANIRDVAKLSGVSVATVSRVINQRGYVHKDTEQKIRSAMEELNFSPNSLARGLANKETKTIALIVPDIMNPFFPELARAVEDTAASLGFTVILCNSDGMNEKELQYIKILKQRYVDGIIFVSHQIHLEELQNIIDSGIPVVCVDRAPEISNLPYIRVNDYEGAVLATEHLLSIGCQKIAHITGPKNLLPSIERHRGFVKTLSNAGCYSSEYVIEGDFTTDTAISLTHHLLNRFPDIDGIFASNDSMAIGALKALIRLNKQVPKDVALIGFDGIKLCEMVEPEISTIAQPIYEIGKVAVQQLVDQIISVGPFSGETNRLQVQLIQRASTLRN